MALTSVQIASTPKQIAVSGTTTAVYTVPAGRRFVGYVLQSGTSGTTQVNGVSWNNSNLQTFVGGTVIGSSASGITTTIVGVEQ